MKMKCYKRKCCWCIFGRCWADGGGKNCIFRISTKPTLAQAKDLLQDTVNKLQAENRELRIKLSEKTSFIGALIKTEQYYCKTCGLYGCNMEQHVKHCKAETITLRRRTIELEAMIKVYNTTAERESK